MCLCIWELSVYGAESYKPLLLELWWAYCSIRMEVIWTWPLKSYSPSDSPFLWWVRAQGVSSWKQWCSRSWWYRGRNRTPPQRKGGIIPESFMYIGTREGLVSSLRPDKYIRPQPPCWLRSCSTHHVPEFHLVPAVCGSSIIWLPWWYGMVTGRTWDTETLYQRSGPPSVCFYTLKPLASLLLQGSHLRSACTWRNWKERTIIKHHSSLWFKMPKPSRSSLLYAVDSTFDSATSWGSFLPSFLSSFRPSFLPPLLPSSICPSFFPSFHPSSLLPSFFKVGVSLVPQSTLLHSWECLSCGFCFWNQREEHTCVIEQFNICSLASIRFSSGSIPTFWPW